jgi:predicted nucleic acid-binding Zn ribbon protein
LIGWSAYGAKQMPLYTYRCQKCQRLVELIVKYKYRDQPWTHEDECGGKLVREGLELPTIGKSGFQTKAVLSDGSHLAGHFGKEASRRKKR